MNAMDDALLAVLRSVDTPTVCNAIEVIEGKRGYGCSGWRDGCAFVLWKVHKGNNLTVNVHDWRT